MELMTVIREREEATAKAQADARAVAEGGRPNETPLQRLTQKITRRAKGRR